MSATVHSISSGPTLVSGGIRLSRAEESALNIMLRRAGGEEDGKALYKIGWSLEDNCCTWDETSGQYKYDPDKKTPICFEANQASYHLLSWVPPSPALFEHEHELRGENVEEGTYECILHFLDPKTQQPFAPTGNIIDYIVPVLKNMHEIAYAARRGFQATVQNLRRQKVESIKETEKQKSAAYDAYAQSLLEQEAPAFEGRPTSFQGSKRKNTSDLKPGESLILSSSEAKKREKRDKVIQPDEFISSTKSRRSDPSTDRRL